MELIKLIDNIAIPRIIIVITICINCRINLFFFEYPKFSQFKFDGLSHSIGFGYLLSIIMISFFILSFLSFFLHIKRSRNELLLEFSYAFLKISAPSIDLKRINAYTIYSLLNLLRSPFEAV